MTSMRRSLMTAIAAVLWLAALLSPAASEEAYFDVADLNSGLGEPPPFIDRSTPRATLETLVRLGDADDWDAAAHVLDLSDYSEADQRVTGPRLARMLDAIIERKIVIDWSLVVDRPDGMDANETSRSATAGMARKSLLLWEFSKGGVPYAIRLNRLKPEDAPPVWVFSARSVRWIEPTYSDYGPSRLEGLLPEQLRDTVIWGIMWWELFGVPVLIALATAAGYAVRRIFTFLQSRTDSNKARAILDAARNPATIATVTTVVWAFVSTVFVFSGRIDVVLSPLIAVGFVTALLMLIVNVVEAILDRLVGSDDVDLSSRAAADRRDMATKLAALRRAMVLAVFVAGVGIVLSTADVFRTLGLSLLASAGALTLVLGLAARNVLGNIMASLQIALNQSARIGDRVVYKDHICHVERIHFTYVQLLDWTGTRLIVPVTEFVSETFENWTLKEPEMLRVLKLKLDPRTDMAVLRKAFDEVIAELDQGELDDLEKVAVKVTGQDVFGMDVWFLVPCLDPNTSWDIACVAREKLLQRLARHEQENDVTLFPSYAVADAA